MAYIPINTSAGTKASQLQGGISQLRSVVGLLKDLYSNMTVMQGSTEVEVYFGVSTGNGQAVMDMLQGLKKLSECTTYQDVQALTDDELLRLGQLLRQLG